MKAGIYKRRDNGKHIYVAKDRSIRAHQLADCHPVEAGVLKVSCSEKEQVVSFEYYTEDMQNIVKVVADRVADIPNGTTNHDEYLQHYVTHHGVADVSHLVHVDESGRRTEIGVLSQPVEFTPADFEARSSSSPPLPEEGLPNKQMLTYAEGAAVEVLFDGLPTDGYAEHAAQVYSKNPGERVIGMPRSLGIGYGAESLLKSAADVRAADAGVPEHVADKIRDDFRQVFGMPGSPLVPMDFSKIEARVSAHVGTFYDVGQEPQPGDVLIRFADQGQQVTHWVVRDGRLLCAHPVTDHWKGGELVNQSDVLSRHARPRVVVGESGEVTVGNPVISAVEFDRPRLSRFEQQMVQERNAAMIAQEMMAKAFFAEALGIVEIFMDEIVVLDGDRWETLESEVRDGRYAIETVLMGIGIRDRQTGELHLVEDRKARYIASTYGFRIGGTVEEPTVIRTKDLSVRVTGRPMPKAMKRHGAVGAAATNDYEQEQLLRIERGEIRLIGKQSKRKHRRAGHRVFWCAPLNSWAWEVQS